MGGQGRWLDKVVQPDNVLVTSEPLIRVWPIVTRPSHPNRPSDLRDRGELF